MDALRNLKLSVMKIHDLAQQSLLLSPSAGHISGHMWFYSPKTQQECKSQQERDEREGVAHGVHQLQGGQQGIVLHLDTGRADMTTRMQSVTPPSPQLHAQSHPGARHELRPSLSRKPAVRPFLLNSVGTQIVQHERAG